MLVCPSIKPIDDRGQELFVSARYFSVLHASTGSGSDSPPDRRGWQKRRERGRGEERVRWLMADERRESDERFHNLR
jgi:hypothetical protein